MNEAEVKLNVFRLVDDLQGEQLMQVYELLIKLLQTQMQEAVSQVSTWENLDEGYQQMANDEQREMEANEWMEGTLDHFEA